MRYFIYLTPCVPLSFEGEGEGQHYGDRFDFRDNRITATGETRKEQRQKYDKRREEVLPANGIKLLIICDYEITGNSEDDLRLVKQKLKSMGLSA